MILFAGRNQNKEKGHLYQRFIKMIFRNIASNNLVTATFS